MKTSESVIHQDIAVTSIGMISPWGQAFEEQYLALQNKNCSKDARDYQIKNYNLETLLSDRKIVKAVSRRDLVGLVAFEKCLQATNKDDYSPERTGIYIGACSTSHGDNDRYKRCIDTCVTDYGQSFDESKFGSALSLANPMSLLISLPNNVLCYAAKIADARGPNSNYMCQEISAHVATIRALSNLRMNTVDRAFCGGFSSYDDPVFHSCLEQRKLLRKKFPGDEYFVLDSLSQNFEAARGTIVTEGSVFLCLERMDSVKSRAEKPLCKILGGATMNDDCGPYEQNIESNTLTCLLRTLIGSHNIFLEQIGVVFLSGAGISSVDYIERESMKTVFADSHTKPLVAYTSHKWGNLIEAGGLAEIGVFAHWANESSEQRRNLAYELCGPAIVSSSYWDPRKQPLGLVVRSNIWGDYSCLLVSVES